MNKLKQLDVFHSYLKVFHKDLVNNLPEKQWEFRERVHDNFKSIIHRDDVSNNAYSLITTKCPHAIISFTYNSALMQSLGILLPDQDIRFQSIDICPLCGHIYSIK